MMLSGQLGPCVAGCSLPTATGRTAAVRPSRNTTQEIEIEESV